jgi:hypothetical protein
MTERFKNCKKINVKPLIKESKEGYTRTAHHSLWIPPCDKLTLEEHFDLYNLYYRPNTSYCDSLSFKTYYARQDSSEQITFYAAGDKCPYIEVNLKPDDDCIALYGDSKSQSYLLKHVLYTNKARILFERLSKDIKYSGYYYPKLLSVLTYSKLLLKHGV